LAVAGGVWAFGTACLEDLWTARARLPGRMLPRRENRQQRARIMSAIFAHKGTEREQQQLSPVLGVSAHGKGGVVWNDAPASVPVVWCIAV
jgi:hypothetical protein